MIGNASSPASPEVDERWVLAVDFGTTNTVAAIGDDTGVRTMTIDGKTIMLSAVLLDAGPGRPDRWIVGERAVNMARRRTEWFDQTPKKRIPDGSLFLGGRNVPVVEVVAEVLRVVVDEAAKQQGSRPPETFVVTHPASWPQARIAVLEEAARTAASTHDGWPAPDTLPEPVAAAERMLEVAAVPTAARIVVLDLGGGTVDAATVDIATPEPVDDGRPEPELTVVGYPTGIEDAGGEDFDYRLAVAMVERAGAPDLYPQLVGSDDPEERERAFEILSLAKNVKEELSRKTDIPVPLPKVPPHLPETKSVQVTRTQLEELIKGGPGNPPGLANAVDLAKAARRDAPSGGPAFAGVYLVGGSSRIPMLTRLIQEQIGRPPIMGGDPSTTVADGAARHALRLLPSVPSRPRTRWRGILAGVVAALLVVGVVAATLIPPRPPTSPQPSPTPVPTPSRIADSGDPMLTTCPTAGEGDCSAKILAVAHAAWPMLPTAGCTVHDSLFGIDAYSVECRTSETTHLVFWRRSGSVVSSLAGQMMMPTTADFVLPGSSERLGSQVGGTRPTSTGSRYTCAWEYEAYPMTMVIDGPNDNATVALCSTATFLDTAGLHSALEAR
ncbi:Hsp70 family protein [Pseudonocardia sp. DSM 110487]|uniref:Hsp70 family protein n=1 Tax=Pseudonocardia sp. DSM 110487 TaxID=2865833 RepID=UPI001C6A4794|nr:Hsp70 family protein [Pseudonocardia sp. DSM 110487]QYN38301.1 Hsp70 family protein [Pseudonocardia sp. DSM 110487]